MMFVRGVSLNCQLFRDTGIQELIAIAKEIGLEGVAVQKFVGKYQEVERQARQLDEKKSKRRQHYWKRRWYLRKQGWHLRR